MRARPTASALVLCAVSSFALSGCRSRCCEPVAAPPEPCRGNDDPSLGGSAPAPRAEAPSWAHVSKEQVAEAERLKVPVAFENSIGMRFVLVPSGKFLMGSPPGEEGRHRNETQHQVTLSKAYYVSIWETTNGQYRKYKPDHDSGSYEGEALNGDDQPVVNVGHDDASSFVAWLSGRDSGRVYRLPTEAEWEYACRAGTRTARWWGDEDAGAKGRASVFDSASKAKFTLNWDSFAFDDGYRVTAPVGTFAPSAWGLYDMLGNADEWCADWYAGYPSGAATDPVGPTSGSTGSTRVLRGASWDDARGDVRAAFRDRCAPGFRDDYDGFRVVVSLRAP